jgi:hypothetical protein
VFAPGDGAGSFSVPQGKTGQTKLGGDVSITNRHLVVTYGLEYTSYDSATYGFTAAQLNIINGTTVLQPNREFLNGGHGTNGENSVNLVNVRMYQGADCIDGAHGGSRAYGAQGTDADNIILGADSEDAVHGGDGGDGGVGTDHFIWSDIGGVRASGDIVHIPTPTLDLTNLTSI